MTSQAAAAQKDNGGRGCIRRLPEHVVNRIAAGEVVVRPSAALKELLENSLDAEATSITVTARDGGLRLLQISDNGKGISHSDLPLLCERFATSKISTFEDLRVVQTFGFRGEALASITHVARVSVLTKTADSTVGYKASYLDSALRGEPTACAATDGTTISVEDMFYNLPTRRTALKSPAEEYRSIVDVAARYAIRYPHVAFVCRRQGASSGGRQPHAADVRTTAGVTALDNIRAAFGSQVASETMTFDITLPTEQASASAITSTANFSMKKGVFIFFVNGRLVESAAFKRAIWAAYASFLPKSGQPFVFVDLKMRPEDIDVNVHPMKKEVRFLHESVIIEAFVAKLSEALKGTESSRSFLAQAVIVRSSASQPAAFPSPANKAPQGTNSNDENEPVCLPGGDFETVDIDPENPQADNDKEALNVAIETGDVDGYILDQPNIQPACGSEFDLDSPEEVTPTRTAAVVAKRPRQAILSRAGVVEPQLKPSSARKPVNPKDKMRTGSSNPVGLLDRYLSKGTNFSVAVDVRANRKRSSHAMPMLTSIKNLLQECKDNSHKGLAQLLKEHIFVGVASSKFVLMQHGVKLLLAEIEPLLVQLMYQQTLIRFADHALFRVQPSAPILRVLSSYITNMSKKATDDIIISAESCVTLLLEKSGMIEEYFGLKVSGEDAGTATLEELPLVFPGVVPDMNYLGEFLYKFVLQTDWCEEEACFRGVAEAIAGWYGKHWNPLPSSQPKESENEAGQKTAGSGFQTDERDREWTLNQVLFSALRSEFYPPKMFFSNKVVREITTTAKLYKIFERC